MNVPPATSSGTSFGPRARSARSLMGALKAEKIFFLGVLDDRDNQSPVEGDGDAQVDITVIVNAIAFDRRVDDRELAGAVNGGAAEERHEGQLGPRPALKIVLQAMADLTMWVMSTS